MSTSFHESLIRVLSDPSVVPPENIIELNFTSFLEFLRGFSRHELVLFAVGEAELVLPIWVAEFPEDDRPKLAIENTKRWLVDGVMPDLMSADAYAAAGGAYDAAAASYAAWAAWAASSAASAACDAACDAADASYAAASASVRARQSDPLITVEDQLRRLFIIEAK